MIDRTEVITADRRQKCRSLQDSGVGVYPSPGFHPSHKATSVLTEYEMLAQTAQPVSIAGRITAKREMGKAAFFDLFSEGQRLQAHIKRSEVGDTVWEIWKHLDIGDFVGLMGSVFITHAGEITLKVSGLVVLGKAGLSIPIGKNGFSALKEKGELYRQRHVGLLTNPSTRGVFFKRAEIIKEIRAYLDGQGFLEVETPVLGPYYSGAAARPFSTHLNTFDQDMFLRISPECRLKAILCGGIERVYELGKNFRNEAADASHNPEFTMLEFYECWADYYDHQIRFESMVAQAAERVHGTTKISYRGRPMDLTPPWRRLPMLDALVEYASLKLTDTSVEDMPALFRQHHPAGMAGLPEPLTWGAAIVELFEKLVEPHLWEPVFIMDHPVEISPLTKRHRSNSRLVERFEPMVAGLEVGNAYSELNDPEEQFERLLSQHVSQEDAYDLDEDFLRAVAHGMPQAAGCGMGIDRIVMILTDAQSIRDVIFFPFVRRSNDSPDDRHHVSDDAFAGATITSIARSNTPWEDGIG